MTNFWLTAKWFHKSQSNSKKQVSSYWHYTNMCPNSLYVSINFEWNGTIYYGESM
jgi:hypothetical protein